MAKCWETRGCDEDMQAGCPHAQDKSDLCPMRCAYAACMRPTYRLTSDPDLLFDPTIDRSAAIKEGCRYCEFFHAHGPRTG